MIDQLVLGFDRALRTVFANASTVRPTPGEDLPEFDEGGAELFERPAQLLGGREAREFGGGLPDLAGVVTQRGYSRFYPTGPSVGHLIGYVGPASAADYEKEHNPLLVTPGFKIGNVIVMAGVPSIMQAMMDIVSPKLKSGVRMLSDSVRANAREGDIGTPLRAIQEANPDTSIGSYPFMDENGKPNTNVVVRSRDEAKLKAAAVSLVMGIERLDALRNGRRPACPAWREKRLGWDRRLWLHP